MAGSRAWAAATCAIKVTLLAAAGEVLALLARGTASRRVSETRMNSSSSRSHVVFACNIETRSVEHGLTQTRRSCLNLVDLAGALPVPATCWQTPADHMSLVSAPAMRRRERETEEVGVPRRTAEGGFQHQQVPQHSGLGHQDLGRRRGARALPILPPDIPPAGVPADSRAPAHHALEVAVAER